MEFPVLPPEINSSRMYMGAGSGPMLAASAAWNWLSGELTSAASSFGSVTSGLAGGPWQGPSAVAMTAVASTYLGWLSTAAAHSEAAAGQAQAVAGAFEAALTATVHPVMVEANRSQLVQLVMSNLLGQSAAAIAATEAAYEQMWAQDVAALLGYHGSASAAAAQLPPLPNILGAMSMPAQALLGGAPIGSAAPGQTAAAVGQQPGGPGGLSNDNTGTAGAGGTSTDPGVVGGSGVAGPVGNGGTGAMSTNPGVGGGSWAGGLTHNGATTAAVGPSPLAFPLVPPAATNPVASGPPAAPAGPAEPTPSTTPAGNADAAEPASPEAPAIKAAPVGLASSAAPPASVKTAGPVSSATRMVGTAEVASSGARLRTAPTPDRSAPAGRLRPAPFQTSG